MRSKNTCKTCAVGMGGQLGGMVNEGGHFPEVCKKSFQAMASDLQGALRTEFIEKTSLNQLRAMTSRQLEMSGRICEPLYLAKGATSYKVTTWEHAISLLIARHPKPQDRGGSRSGPRGDDRGSSRGRGRRGPGDR